MAPETIVHAVAENCMSTHSQAPATLPQISTKQSRTACRLEILYMAHRLLENPVVVGSWWHVVHAKKVLANEGVSCWTQAICRSVVSKPKGKSKHIEPKCTGCCVQQNQDSNMLCKLGSHTSDGKLQTKGDWFGLHQLMQTRHDSSWTVSADELPRHHCSQNKQQ